jgi:hypothetical protein
MMNCFNTTSSQIKSVRFTDLGISVISLQLLQSIILKLQFGISFNKGHDRHSNMLRLADGSIISRFGQLLQYKFVINFIDLITCTHSQSLQSITLSLSNID